MAAVEIKLNLPNSLLREAKASGLLAPPSIKSLLQAEIRRRRVKKLFSAMDRLAASKPPLTEEEIEAEIQTVRAERRKAHAGRR